MWILPTNLLPVRPCSLSVLASEDSISGSKQRCRRLALSWMESLEATRASRSASPANASAPTTSATSGRTSLMSSIASVRLGASSKTWLDISGWDSETFALIFDEWVTELRRVCLRRRKSVQPTGENGYSSLQWPTPNTPNGGRVMNPSAVAANGATAQGKRQLDLGSAVRLWATPDAAGFNATQSEEAWAIRHERELAKGYNGNGGGTPLAMQVKLWPSPHASAYTGAGMGTLEAGPNLQTAVAQSYQHFHQLETTSPPGPTSSPAAAKLNPLFVEWLMGLPLGLTAFAPSGMASYHYRLRTRLQFLLQRLELAERTQNE